MFTPAPAPALSPAQERVYARLLEHQRLEGRPPELSELARSMGVHYVTLRQHLEALHTKGYLTFESRGRGRSPLLELPPEATGVPLLGEIPAGAAALAEGHIEAYLPALPGAGGSRVEFALRVHGYSMADLIQPRDIVLLATTVRPAPGEICAVRVGEDDATLKYVVPLPGGAYELRAHNPDFPTVRVPGEELRVDGAYRGLLRGPAAEALLTRA